MGKSVEKQAEEFGILRVPGTGHGAMGAWQRARRTAWGARPANANHSIKFLSSIAVVYAVDSCMQLDKAVDWR
jgi:hypothetical protein